MASLSSKRPHRHPGGCSMISKQTKYSDALIKLIASLAANSFQTTLAHACLQRIIFSFLLEPGLQN